MEGVAVVLQGEGGRSYGVLTDRNGFYQVGGIRPGTYALQVRELGYAPRSQQVTLSPGQQLRLSFSLDLNPVELEGIEVAPEKGPAIRDLGRQVVTSAEIARIPVPAGAGDLATYLQTLPGVTTTSDRGGQVFVRGGTPAENLVLVDDIPIYQPYHILGFFSVFPEDLVSGADFYAGGFGARYSGRTSSVLDVRLRDGDPRRYRGMASVGPFIAEGMAEGPAGTGTSWLASVRRSLVEETSEKLLGSVQPLTFNSALLKVTSTNGETQRCSALALRTSDRGRLDPQETDSRIAWSNDLLGGRCVTQGGGVLRLIEVSFSYSGFENEAVSRGSSSFRSRVRRVQHDMNATTMIGAIPVYAGYQLYSERVQYDLTELFGMGRNDVNAFGASAYLEGGVPLGRRGEVRPGLVLAGLPVAGLEPRLRASWQPFGRATEQLQGAFGLYRQYVLATSDMRDVGNVFEAWMTPPGGVPLRVAYGSLGWQQALGALHWSVEAYSKRLKDVPVPAWTATAKFTTRLLSADGEAHGVDARLEYARRHLYGFVGYGYGWTQYEVSQPEFSTWFGTAVQSYHPPHDRRHQVNAVASVDARRFRASARWQLGSGLPFTRPLGIGEAFNYAVALPELSRELGSTRLLLDRPYNARLPVVHRLDASVERSFELPLGKLQVQAGAINLYGRRNLFYYDLFTGREVDQLPRAPYASLTFRSR